MRKKLFSERYGYTKPELDIHALYNRVWNAFVNLIFSKIDRDMFGELLGDKGKFVLNLWDSFYKERIDELKKLNILSALKSKFFEEVNLYRLFDFLEFFFLNFPEHYKKYEIVTSLNNIFEEELVPYRIIDGVVTPIESEEEREEIEKALEEEDKFWPARQHIKKALELFSDRENPDYLNSIKESISAIEAMVQIILGQKGTLGRIIKMLNIHPALKKGFNHLYGWTSDEKGVRHGSTGEPLSAGQEEARYMLITSSAFINYLVEKYRKGELIGKHEKGG